jgi:hypothetical protein
MANKPITIDHSELIGDEIPEQGEAVYTAEEVDSILDRANAVQLIAIHAQRKRVLTHHEHHQKMLTEMERMYKDLDEEGDQYQGVSFRINLLERLTKVQKAAVESAKLLTDLERKIYELDFMTADAQDSIDTVLKRLNNALNP